MGSITECAPLNLRLVADDSGSFTPPDNNFAFPESGSCKGAPGATYGAQPIIFTVDSATFPLLFTTGGGSNTFFQVSTTTFGGVNIMIPGNAG